MSADERFFDGFLDDYFVESSEHLTAAGDAVLALESAIGNPAAERSAIDDLFRCFHTLKAISAMVELRPAEQLAHSLESYLRAIREDETELSVEGTDILMDGTRRLEQIVAAHRAKHDQPSIADIVERVERLARERQRTRSPEMKLADTVSRRRWICAF